MTNATESVKPRYVVAILAVIIGVRIASAMAILLLWFPELREHPRLFLEPDLLFPFIDSREGQWRAALFAGVMSSALAIPLTVLLSRYFGRSEAYSETFLTIGVGAFLLDVIATTMNLLGTLYLAQMYMQDPSSQDLATHLWGWQEVWRDEGLKTISFMGIGMFTVWLGLQMRRFPTAKFVEWSTFAFGGLMLLIGVLDMVGLFELGEYGIASGFGHIFYAIWGLALGYWFWFKAPPRRQV